MKTFIVEFLRGFGLKPPEGDQIFTTFLPLMIDSAPTQLYRLFLEQLEKYFVLTNVRFEYIAVTSQMA